MKARPLGMLGLSLIALGALLAGCQRGTELTPGAAPPSSGGAHQPVNDDPAQTPSADDDTLPEERGVVSGRVRSPSGAAVVDAAVQVRSLDVPPVPVPELVVTTDEDGYFRWLLAPGRYEISVIPAGGAPAVTGPTVDVQPGAQRTIDITVR